MNVDESLVLLGGLSPAQFMRRHWQKKPLLVRQAIPGFAPLVPRAELFGLAGREDVESRLLRHGDGRWALRRGPLARRALPPLTQREWTVLVQGVDLHHAGVHALMQRPYPAEFRCDIRRRVYLGSDSAIPVPLRYA